ncbi:MAG: phage holin family protein, partial [Actinomycetota bacterium]|nr:phage holin family protein [Actinomycetota bacterium]
QAPPPAPEAASNERSIGDLFSDLTDNLRALVQRELELVKIEMKDQVNRGVKGVSMFAGAGVTGFVALLLVAMAAAWGLAEVVAPGWAFLIVGVVFGAVAAVLGLQGKKKFEQLNPVPRQTIETVKQDVQVAKESLSEGATGDQPSNQSGDVPQQWGPAGTGQYATRRS